MRLLLQLLLFFCASPLILACSCVGNSSTFDLSEYDASYDVVEVVFLKLEEKEEKAHKLGKEIFDSLQVIYLRGDKSGIPPPPPPPPPTEITLYGEILTSFKGAILADTVTFRTSKDGASCGWLPRFGEPFIIYLGPSEDNNENIYGLSSCQRKLYSQSSYNRYLEERDILIELRDKQDGLLAPRQVIEHDSFGDFMIPFQGEFLEGKRVGKWSFYQPYFRAGQIFDPAKVAFNLCYNQGELVEVAFLPKQKSSDLPDRVRWLLWRYTMRFE